MTQPKKTHYHSTVSRRDFMKFLGMGTASAAVGGTLLGGGFKDLDDMMASPAASRNLPFWVREVDEPTVQIDWDNMEVYPHLGMSLFNPMAWGDDGEEWGRIQATNIESTTQAIRDNLPGYSLKDHALGDAQCWGWGPTSDVMPSWTGPDVQANMMWEHPTMFRTPEEFGVPRYEGSPEENSRMLRVAGRILGAADMGFVKLDDRTKKLLYGNIVFEDVEEGYDDPERHVSVLPDKDLWVICAVIPQSLNHYTDRFSWANSNTAAYSRAHIYSNRIKVFLRGLGYQHYGGGTGSVGRAVGFGVMAGLAEYGRPGIMVSPQFGTNFRTVMLTVTDLPLEVTKPIDAGITRFCQTCKKCAEQCPSGAISTDDEPSWASWADGEQPWQAKGIKGWYLKAKNCYSYMLGGEPDCNRCQTVCPFSKFDEAVMHDLIRLSISNAPALNGVIRQMDDVFGYGRQRGDALWEMDPMDIPLWGLDSSRS